MATYPDSVSGNLKLKSYKRVSSSPDPSQQSDGLRVKKRNGKLVNFDQNRIRIAVEKAFRAEKNIPNDQHLDAFSAREAAVVADKTFVRLLKSLDGTSVAFIEDIQDLVEIVLMQQGHYAVAKRYIVYREQRAKARDNNSLTPT
jgi:ribonucleoside-diphosphate reductase alpha chain